MIRIEDNFPLHITVQPETGCHEWQRAKDDHGYGRVRVAGRQMLAHKAAWEAAHGPVPAGQVLRHTCDNTSCVNYRHLVLGTQKDNARDMMVRSRAGLQKLNAPDVLAIRAMRAGGKLLREISEAFGICESQASNIVRGQQWSHL